MNVDWCELQVMVKVMSMEINCPSDYILFGADNTVLETICAPETVKKTYTMLPRPVGKLQGLWAEFTNNIIQMNKRKKER